MLRSLSTARTGLDAQQVSLEVISNNLANATTTGFKRSRAVFEDLLYQNIIQPGAQSSQTTQISNGLQVGAGVRPVSTARVMTQGSLTETSNSLDVAINGAGFLQVLLPDGTTAYTRDGSFQQDNQGQLVTAAGYVVQPTITIPITATSVTIASDGIVTITQTGTTATTQVGQLLLANFVNTGGLQSVGENLYLETASSGAATVNTPGQNGAGTLNQKYVEASNVNVAEELVNMIQTQRIYEMNSKVVSTADAMLAKLTAL